ncbi:hypothetical protein COCSUDRAFT_62808 [Coccomyxa subellipsoidea C-169]|uniref:Uncharacterized protein n=1 Tax=Coccomyxa subellipsoidea (strain C-169) TaxID=574566 RepID=I0Z0Y8_COCSC|nr:hypothetical protein COCSUDRAFT_62808 [Coccomyxa subellipsoidea C-169]EIE24307.1 hypothetical protein COCSUDRAFT_62808 [Coccomyxa subellipsoidea C-169]|eukprot:XP_005648851.1 hypothetical protein COCSUDRAFT_62808 [Coccomyxa subellipsoidea C-169]
MIAPVGKLTFLKCPTFLGFGDYLKHTVQLYRSADDTCTPTEGRLLVPQIDRIVNLSPSSGRHATIMIGTPEVVEIRHIIFTNMQMGVFVFVLYYMWGRLPWWQAIAVALVATQSFVVIPFSVAIFKGVMGWV